MFDMHYDLLTKIYMCYKEKDFSYIEKWIKNYRHDNVRGLIANLCFMSKEEMIEQYHPKYYDENVPVVKMFEVATSYLHKYCGDDINILTSIEGCDYLEVDDLETLKKLGLNAIVPVWNNKSRYGSGNRSDMGLTLEGEKLIHKAIKLNLGIDLSHANEKTFDDIINIVIKYRHNGLYPIIYASHSNARLLSDIPRNLTDEQIKKLGMVDGIIGVMSNCNFVYKDSLKEKQRLKGTEYTRYVSSLKDVYIHHIKHIEKLIGIDKVAVSTDDMHFCESILDYRDTAIYAYETISNDLRETLSKYYDKRDIDKIMYDNAFHLYNKLKESYEKGCK